MMMINLEAENNVLQFERREEQSATLTLEETVVDSAAEAAICSDGVCVLAWKPRRPTAAA